MSFVLLSGYNALGWIASLIGWRVGAMAALAVVGRKLLKMAVRNYGGPLAYLPDYLTSYVINRASPTLLLVGTGNVVAGISVQAAYLVLQTVGVGTATMVVRLSIAGAKATVCAVAQGAKAIAKLPQLLMREADERVRKDMSDGTQYLGEWEVVSSQTANINQDVPRIGDSILLQCSVEEAESILQSVNLKPVDIEDDALVDVLSKSVNFASSINSSEGEFPQLEDATSSIEWLDAASFEGAPQEANPNLTASYLTASWITIDVKPPSAPPISFSDDFGSRLLNDGGDVTNDERKPLPA